MSLQGSIDKPGYIVTGRVNEIDHILMTAYGIALKNGFEGTEEEWLKTLEGKSAYEVACEEGFEGTPDEWLESLLMESDAIRYKQQTLTAAQKAQARTNIDAASVSSVNTVEEYAKTVNAKANAAVSVKPQTLTLAQQAQARKNIKAVTEEDVMVIARADLAESNPYANGYVKNRTHWVDETSKDGVLLEETAVEFKMEMASVSGIGTDGIKKGGKYLVDWNGTRYDCEAYELIGSVCLGNAALLGSETDTGEPFAIEAITADGCTLVKNNSAAESVTLAVTGVENTVWHQLDPRFIPDMYYTEEGGGSGEVIFPETTLTFDGNAENADGLYFIPDQIDIVVGQTYTVNWNGTEYTSTCIDSGAINPEFIGGSVLVNEGADFTTGEGLIFVIFAVQADKVADYGFGAQIVDASLALSVTFSITSGSGETIHKLDNKYLDLAWLPTAAKTVYIPETTATTSGTVDIGDETAYLANLVDDTGIFGTDEIAGLNGREVTVCYDGVEYTGTGYASLDSTYIGAPGGGFIDGEFMLMEGGKVWVLMTKTEGAHTVEAYFKEPNKMPAEFLPEPVIVDCSVLTLVTGEDLTIPLADAFGAAAFAEVIEQLRNGVRVGLTISFQPKTSAGTGDVSAYTMMFSGSTYNGRLQWSGTYIDGSAVHEINVQVDPATGMLYAMAREVTGSGSGSGSLPEGFDPLAVVSTKVQSFTPEQQAQARTNIGAAAASVKQTAEDAKAAAEARVSYQAVQSLTETQRKTARNNISAVSWEADQGLNDFARYNARTNIKAVSYEQAPQTELTEEEKAQARANIGAASVNEEFPKNHASTTDEYGKADDSHYGHVVLSDFATEVNTHQNGVAATPHAVWDATHHRVSFGTQILTDAQKAQARANIGAASTEDVENVQSSSAPKSHLSRTGEYGAATNRMYGHVMLSDDIHNDQVQGTAASTAGVSRAIRGMLVYNPQQLPEEYKAQARANIGAGEPADWGAGEDETGYIKNRTHWAEFSGEEIIAEKTMEYPLSSNGLADVSGNYAKIVNGSKCVVTWDGVKYNCVAGLRGETVYFGNMGALDSNFSMTGEPFCAYKTGDRTMVVVAVDKAENTMETHTYKLELDATTYHTLDLNFLPDTVLKTTAQALTEDQQAQVRANIGAAVAGETGIGAQSDWNAAEGEEGYVRNRTHWRDMVLGETILPATAVTVTGTMGEITGIGTNDFVEGGSYTVTWDGTDYTCICQNYNGLLLGNASMYGAGENTGEPFVFDIFDTDEIGVQVEGHTTDPATTHTVIIRENQMVYHKLPEEYLPESVDGVVIRSSTAGSTKKFRITVDDSGTISATEV